MFSFTNLKQVDRAKILKKRNYKCSHCDNGATRILASNVYNPHLRREELREENFNTFCEGCASDHINWTINKAVGGSFTLLIWELMKDGTITEL